MWQISKPPLSALSEDLSSAKHSGGPAGTVWVCDLRTAFVVLALVRFS
jgi:hypothetical protein